MPPIKNENPQRSPYQHLTLQRSDSLPIASCTSLFGDGSLIGGSSSSLETIGAPINHEDPQLLPYPSSTDVQSNGDICNASFMTSLSEGSLFEVPTDIEDRAIIDQATIVNMRAVRRQQIKNKILSVARFQHMFQNLRYATAIDRWIYTHVGHIQ